MHDGQFNKYKEVVAVSAGFQIILMRLIADDRKTRQQVFELSRLCGKTVG